MYDFPLNMADYLHRVGRTARGGRAGRVTTITPRRYWPFVAKIQEATKEGKPIEVKNMSSTLDLIFVVVFLEWRGILDIILKWIELNLSIAICEMFNDFERFFWLRWHLSLGSQAKKMSDQKQKLRSKKGEVAIFKSRNLSFCWVQSWHVSVTIWRGLCIRHDPPTQAVSKRSQLIGSTGIFNILEYFIYFRHPIAPMCFVYPWTRKPRLMLPSTDRTSWSNAPKR